MEYMCKLPCALKLKLQQVCFKFTLPVDTYLSQSRGKVEMRRRNAAYGHHYPIEGAITRQIPVHLPIPISYHEQYNILVK